MVFVGKNVTDFFLLTPPQDPHRSSWKGLHHSDEKSTSGKSGANTPQHARYPSQKGKQPDSYSSSQERGSQGLERGSQGLERGSQGQDRGSQGQDRGSQGPNGPSQNRSPSQQQDFQDPVSSRLFDDLLSVLLKQAGGKGSGKAPEMTLSSVNIEDFLGTLSSAAPGIPPKHLHRGLLAAADRMKGRVEGKDQYLHPPAADITDVLSGKTTPEGEGEGAGILRSNSPHVPRTPASGSGAEQAHEYSSGGQSAAQARPTNGTGGSRPTNGTGGFHHSETSGQSGVESSGGTYHNPPNNPGYRTDQAQLIDRLGFLRDQLVAEVRESRQDGRHSGLAEVRESRQDGRHSGLRQQGSERPQYPAGERPQHPGLERPQQLDRGHHQDPEWRRDPRYGADTRYGDNTRSYDNGPGYDGYGDSYERSSYGDNFGRTSYHDRERYQPGSRGSGGSNQATHGVTHGVGSYGYGGPQYGDYNRDRDPRDRAPTGDRGYSSHSSQLSRDRPSYDGHHHHQGYDSHTHGHPPPPVRIQSLCTATHPIPSAAFLLSKTVGPSLAQEKVCSPCRYQPFPAKPSTNADPNGVYSESIYNDRGELVCQAVPGLSTKDPYNGKPDAWSHLSCQHRHQLGLCTPCFFYNKKRLNRCDRGEECRFCHLCSETRTRVVDRWKRRDTPFLPRSEGFWDTDQSPCEEAIQLLYKRFYEESGLKMAD